MNERLSAWVVVLALLFALSSARAAASADPLTEPEVTQRYLADAEPDPAVERALEPEVEFVAATYLYNYVDLNGDGKDEVLALLTGPLNCGTGGCTLFVLQHAGATYEVLSEVSLVQGPVLVSEQPKAWRDLIVGVGGGGEAFGYRVLAYQKGGYPSNPTVAPSAALVEPVEAASYLNTTRQRSSGLVLTPKTPHPGNVPTGVSWRWTEITDPVAGTTRISDPDAYRLTFRPKRLEVVTPCLTASFSYTLNEGALRVEGVGTSPCASDSLAARLLEGLAAARLMTSRDDALLIDLFADGGTLRFEQ